MAHGTIFRRTAALLLVLTASSCTKSTPPEAPKAPVLKLAAMRPVRIPFVGQVNGAPFSCTTSYANLGTTAATWQPQDFRFYVSAVQLLRATGEAVDVALEHDDTWQRDGVALIDLEDNSGTCQNGTPATHAMLVGEVAEASDYTGLRFKLALPFALNHADASTAAPPLDQAGLFWSWQGGYKFLTIDGRVNDRAGYSVHVGSTGCRMRSPNQVADCSAPNEAVITLPSFTLGGHSVVADIGALLAGSDLKAGMGCMSEADNAQCAPIFTRLGLPWAGASAGPQSFFGVH